MNQREQAISTIEALYPVDSQYPDTAKIGKELLLRAVLEFSDWRKLPDEILIRYASICEYYETKETNKFLRTN
jgi:hypothetical protein